MRNEGSAKSVLLEAPSELKNLILGCYWLEGGSCQASNLVSHLF